jgi:glutamate decarboxylase
MCAADRPLAWRRAAAIRSDGAEKAKPFQGEVMRDVRDDRGRRRPARILDRERVLLVALQHPTSDRTPSHDLAPSPIFGLECLRVPRRKLRPGGMPADVAYQMIHDELMLDGNARLNVATFVTTWMEPQAQKLMAECLDKNMIDKDEYPQTAELEMRCVNILSGLWNAPDPEQATGCSTTGSSEAAMLGGLALKRLWQQRRKAAGKPADRPNIVMGINVQICWEKLANYWDVEMRLVPMEGSRFTLSAEEAVKLCDENTIGVVAVLGSTFDGSYEPVAEICAALDDLQARTGLDIPVHVDGASGAFIAPFLDPDIEWDFRLPRVSSINASGHKYGLVYPGVGWIVWRDADALPADLIFWVNYLGDNMPTFALNFSRPGAQVVAQYYTFLRLGFDGFRAVQAYSRDVATSLSAQIAEIGPFELLTRGDELPVFAFKVKDEIDNFTVFDVSNALRERGWQVPAYTFPANRTDLAALRVVVRRGFSHDLADMLVSDIKRQLPRLQSQAEPVHGADSKGFHH